MNFLEAIEQGLQKANDVERIRSEITEVLMKLNSSLAKFTNSDAAAFDFTKDSIRQLSPIKIDFNNFSYPMRLECGNLILQAESFRLFVESLYICIQTATFGDYVREQMIITKL
ncbi:hypothetical protein [Acinetobacter baumannii]|uniref:hypothetical protein n=1 Tax=Acinetobacter baumannii TaxID=470 RepID=UPI003F5FF53E